MAIGNPQSEKELHLLVLFGDKERTFIEWADTASELKQLEDYWTAKLNDYSLPKPDFKHWKQEAKKGKCYALRLRIENDGQGYAMDEEGITKDRYDSIIEVNKDMCRNRLEETIRLMRNLPYDVMDKSEI